MKKDNPLQLGLILLAITAIAGLLLGASYSITKAPIEKQTRQTDINAMKEILDDADQFNEKTIKSGHQNISAINEAKAKGKTIGYTIKLSSKGYGGPIEMIVGISTDGRIRGIKILSLSETPGLGANSTKPAFYGQYKNKPIDKPLEVTKTGVTKKNQIEAITGATITSRAVTKGVNDAINYYKTNLKGGDK